MLHYFQLYREIVLVIHDQFQMHVHKEKKEEI